MDGQTDGRTDGEINGQSVQKNSEQQTTAAAAALYRTAVHEDMQHTHARTHAHLAGTFSILISAGAQKIIETVLNGLISNVAVILVVV